MQQQGHLEGPHAASKVRVAQGRRGPPARFLSPHQMGIWVQETILNVLVSERRDVRWRRLWKIRRRRQRVGVTGYVDVLRRGEQEPLDTRTCTIVPAAASVTRADGRVYGGRECLGVPRWQGVHEIRE
jgi:hypothetical protein